MDQAASKQPARLTLVDVVRGFSVASMVLFHFCYDLRYIAAQQLPWFQGAAQDIWRASISWTFLFVAGLMCSFSRDNFRRAAKYGLFAVAIFVVTTVAAVDDPISFGIIYCMAACTFADAVLAKAGASPRGKVAAAVLFVVFLVCLGIPRGHIGVGGLTFALPKEAYSTELLSWLGFPGPHFVSGDYYPLLPYLFMYLAGAALGPGLRAAAQSLPILGLRCTPLEWLGRHALLVYAVHQPVLLVMTALLTGVPL